MTDNRDSNYKALSQPQEARAEALGVAKATLSNTAFFAKTMPESRQIQELIGLAEWIVGDEGLGYTPPNPLRSLVEGGSAQWAFPIPPETIPSLFHLLGKELPDCGHPECPIHAPAREAQDLNPDDAKSEWGATKIVTDPPIDFEGGEADQDARLQLPEAKDFPVGWIAQYDGTDWQVHRNLRGARFWTRNIISRPESEASRYGLGFITVYAGHKWVVREFQHKHVWELVGRVDETAKGE